MDLIKSVGFWSGFALAMILSLTIGGLLKGYPQFGTLLLVSLVVALLAGFFAQRMAVRQATQRVKRGLERGAAFLGKAAIKRRRAQ